MNRGNFCTLFLVLTSGWCLPGCKREPPAVATLPPLMLKTAANLGGLPIEVFDGIRANVLADRS